MIGRPGLPWRGGPWLLNRCRGRRGESGSSGGWGLRRCQLLGCWFRGSWLGGTGLGLLAAGFLLGLEAGIGLAGPFERFAIDPGHRCRTGGNHWRGLGPIKVGPRRGLRW